jgi:di/tricarboxylate transporter
MLLKSLAPNFANPHTAWLVLALASTLAGNLTITGSVANIVIVESAKPETKIGFWEYFRVGLPITLMTLIVGWAWLAGLKRRTHKRKRPRLNYAIKIRPNSSFSSRNVRKRSPMSME